MEVSFLLISFFVFMLIAFFYSSVGHAGASGYLAAMSLLSFPLTSIKPTSLVLNIIVSMIASYKFISAGYFNKKVFLSFAVSSIPLAFVGGYLNLDPRWFKISAGIFLIFSATSLLMKQFLKPEYAKREVNLFVNIILGAIIGLLSGLIGVGGGIFLSPIIILLGYTHWKEASGVAALFILCNSILALAGDYQSLPSLNLYVLLWILAVILGGFAGSHLGVNRFNNRYIVSFLFLVLVSAGIKFMLEL